VLTYIIDFVMGLYQVESTIQEFFLIITEQ